MKHRIKCFELILCLLTACGDVSVAPSKDLSLSVTSNSAGSTGLSDDDEEKRLLSEAEFPDCDSDDESTEEDKEPHNGPIVWASPLETQITQIEDAFWKRKTAECGWSAGTQAAKVTLYATAACAAAYAASYLYTPVMTLAGMGPTDPTGSAASSSKTGGFDVQQFALTAAGFSYVGSEMRSVATEWKTNFVNNYKQLLLDARYTAPGNRFADPELLEVLLMIDQLELKIETIKKLENLSRLELDARTAGIASLLRHAKGFVKVRLGYPQKFWTDSRGAYFTQGSGITPLGRGMYDVYVNMPMGTKTFTDADEKKAAADMKSYFDGTFAPEIEDFFNTQIERIAENSRLPRTAEFRDRINILLLGEGGTGKTESAKALVKAMDLPLCELKGSSLIPSDFSTGGSEAARIVGHMLDCQVNKMDSHGKKYKIGVLLINEIDHLFRSASLGENFESTIKLLLEENSLFDHSAGIYIDIADMIIIGTSNGHLLDMKKRPEHARALNQRWEIMEFGPITRDQKAKVAYHKFFIPMARDRGYSIQDEDKAFIENTLVPYDHSEVKNVGNRVLKGVINQFIIKRKKGMSLEAFEARYKSLFSRLGSLTKEEIEAEISESPDAKRESANPESSKTPEEMHLDNLVRAIQFFAARGGNPLASLSLSLSGGDTAEGK